jgi:hypothetical protein
MQFLRYFEDLGALANQVNLWCPLVLGKTKLSSGIYSRDQLSRCRQMIVRMCSDVVTHSAVDSYLNELFKTIVPLYSGATGLLSLSVLKRRLQAYDEIAVVSSWESSSAMDDCVRRISPAVVPYDVVIRREPVIYELLKNIVFLPTHDG